MKHIIPFLMVLLAFAAVAQKPYKCPNEKALFKLTADQLRARADANDPAAMTRLAEFYSRGCCGVPLDSVQSFSLLQKASSMGYEMATLLMSGYYFDGVVTAKDTQMVFTLRKRLADKGNAAAMALLGRCYERGYGVARDKEKAVELYQRSAAVGDPVAMRRLAGAYSYGLGSLAKDVKKAEALYTKAYAAGCEVAALDLVDLYLDEEEYEKVEPWFDKLRWMNDPYAMFAEANYYILKTQDLAKAEAILKKGLATYSREGILQVLLSRIYTNHKDSTLRDLPKAKQLIEQAIGYGSDFALREMGLHHLWGTFGEVDLAKAEECFQKVLVKDPYDGFSLHILAKIYADDDFAGKDYDKALRYALRGEAEEHAASTALAAGIYQVVKNDMPKAEHYYYEAALWGHDDSWSYLLGMMLDNGDMAKASRYANEAVALGNTEGYYYLFLANYRTDLKTAMSALNKGDKANDIPSILTLGDIYKGGDLGTKANAKKAAAYYEKAGRLGSGKGYHNLANLYLSGSIEGQNQHALFTAIEYLNKAIDLDYVESLYLLGQVYEVDYYGLKDYDKAIDLYTRLAKTGDPRGDFKIGLFYELGDGGLPKDSVKAVEFYQKSADAGYDFAKCYLADFYKLGRYLPLDEKKAFDLYSEAAANGSIEGTYYVGRCYMTGTGVDKDTAEAIRYLRPCAEQGLGRACAYMGDFYMYGRFLPKDVDSAIYYYHIGSKDDDTTCDYEMGQFLSHFGNYKAALEYYLSAGKHGHGESIVELARMIQRGQGTDQDLNQAYHLLQVAASYHNSSAYVELGVAAVNGYGCAQDAALAKSYFDTAASMGNNIAMYNLAMCYENGIGCEPDSNLVVQWLRRSVDHGYTSAINRLGDYYEEGKYVEQSFEKAFELYQKGVELGSYTSMCNLGYCYEKGQGCVLNSKKAYDLYLEAAEGGFARAMYQVANCYAEGVYVEENYPKAVEWFEKAAEAGHYLAQFNLGVIYENGEEGVVVDKKKALKYYTMAAEQGFEPAQAAIDRMKKK